MSPFAGRAAAPLVAALVAAATACAAGPRVALTPTPVASRSVDASETAPESQTATVTSTVTSARSKHDTRAPRARGGSDAGASSPRTAAAPPHVHAPGVTFDLPVHDYETDERVRHYVALFSGPDREDFTVQLERGTRYDALLRTKLRAAGLPEDLRYLALVESGYDPQATSRASAVGMWQFMAGTARESGLRVDWWMDERRDPVRATDAAARNLRWLRAQFGSVFLAAAAYNSGETRISRGLAQLAADDSVRASSARLDSLSQTVLADPVGAPADAGADAVPNDSVRAAAPTTDEPSAAAASAAAPDGDARYFALGSAGYLRPETRNYVPQLIAALLIAKEPSRYGIVVHPQPAYAYDSVRVPALTPLAAVAHAADASRTQILDLNPHLLRGLTPPGASTVVRVPVGRGADATRALADLSAGERRAFRRLATRKHETFDALSDRAGVPSGVLRRYNPELSVVQSGKWKGRLVSGQPVRVPTRDVLAFARDVPDVDGTPLAGLPMPEPEPVPNAAATRATKHARAHGEKTDADVALTEKSGADKPHADKPHAEKPRAEKAHAEKPPVEKAHAQKAHAEQAAKSPSAAAKKAAAAKGHATRKPAHAPKKG